MVGFCVMIFVTVGSMLPFNRMIEMVDAWADGKHQEIFAQIGAGEYIPQNVKWARRIGLREFEQQVASAAVIIAHAGMGTVITSMELGKPLVLIPRHAELNEHTTDHQIHTAKWLKEKPGIFVADTGLELEDAIDLAFSFGSRDRGLFSNAAPSEFTERIRAHLSH
jgi:UDP-N-acetylglucosamine transferase subunit ALG13